MGKLNIAHHKSYHPYRRDNIERVRQDEEEARIKEEQEEGRMLLADAEARITLLRGRAGAGTSAKSRTKEDEKRERELLKQAADPSRPRDEPFSAATNEAGPSSLTAIGGAKHINLFEELEQSTVQVALSKGRELEKLSARNTKKGKEGDEKVETDQGVPLAPSAKDLKPWYSERVRGPVEETNEEHRKRDYSHKARSDPLRAIQRELAEKYPPASASSQQMPSYMNGAAASRRRQTGSSFRAGMEMGVSEGGSRDSGNTSNADSNVDRARSAREARESNERKRALELVARKKRERERMLGSETPSTVRGGEEEDTFRYGNQFNSQAVAEAHRKREAVMGYERGAEVRGREWGAADRSRMGT